jgi:hypothetical protein
MQPDKPRPIITIKRKPRKVAGVATPAPEAIEPAVQVASIEAGQIQPDIEAVELVAAVPEEQAPELTAKQLKKQRRRERQAAEAALLAAAEAEAARVAEMQAEADREAAEAAKAAHIAAARAEKAARLAALTPEERAELERVKAENIATKEAEKLASYDRRMEALKILNTNPVFYYFKPLAIGSDTELKEWALKQGKGALSGKSVRDIIAAHCNHPHYLKKLASGGKRYRPISGSEDGEVTPDQRTAAFEKLLDYDRLRRKTKLERLADSMVLPETLPDDAAEVLPQGQEPLSSD